MSSQKILVGGWAAYAEEHGVNKKELVETFDWLPPQHSPFYYTDLKAALEKVDGAKEWLKNYTKKNRNEYSFSEPIADQIMKLTTVGHSGASGTGLLWDYQSALKDWDTWVFKKKRYAARETYKKAQIDLWTVDSLLCRCDTWLQQDGREDALKLLCEKFEYPFTTVSNLKRVLMPIKADWEMIHKEETKVYEEKKHQELIGCIELLYEHPSRWFDSPQGCGLHPGHPSRITQRAMDEMETKHPGYKNHIDAVLRAMPVFPWSREFTELDWTEKSEVIKDFMHSQGIVGRSK